MIVLKRVLIVAIVALITYAIYEQKKTIKELNTTVGELKSQNDTLQDSLFQTEVELGRYQMALEILKDGEDPKAAKTFEYVLTTQTE